jgi:2-polyprenyl-3-methyl-5-hydroxy-6-metoxy-1,4-benzoquinol methylase
MKRAGEVTDVDYWDQNWASNGVPSRPLARWNPVYGEDGLFTRMVRRELGDLRGKRVLDIGAGGANYRLLGLARWAGAEVSAIDYSRVGLDVLEQTFAANGATVTTYLGDFLDHDFGGAGFDVVVHWGVLEHFVDPEPLLAASARALAPGGRTLFSMPNMEALAAHLWRTRSPMSWSKHVLHREDAIREACGRVGLHFDRAFHFGVPFLHIAEFERGSTRVSRILAGGQRLLEGSSLLLRYLPWGSRRLSTERGFVATRNASSPSTSVPH